MFLFQEWLKVDLSCTKRLNGIKSHRNLSQKDIQAEMKLASQKRKQAVAAANDHWDREKFESMLAVPL